ncbi:hypothetical protein ACNA6I_22860 [Rossellomorea sp. FS2]|uniref:hypothetical protein n=1 Tax=Rossellomorea sp. FS2 TaxID=3391447 RepID=UPI003A4D560F
MILKPNEYGFFDEDSVKNSGLEIYSFDDPPGRDQPVDLWTFTELKDIVKIILTPEERISMIVGFLKADKRQKGFAALYSFHKIVNLRYGTNITYIPAGDE